MIQLHQAYEVKHSILEYLKATFNFKDKRVNEAVFNFINYEHTITKSELYYSQKITYYAPFDKCDRVEDYITAWGQFEKVFIDQIK